MQERYSSMKEWEKSDSFLGAFKNAWGGLVSAYKEEKNLRRQLNILLFTLIAAGIFQISLVQWMILISVSTLVITLELLNTALERLEDLVHPEYHSAIKYSKDAAAAAVLVASMAAVIVGFLMFLPPIWKLVV